MSIAAHRGQVHTPTAFATVAPLPLLIGSVALVTSVLYLLSDILEFFQGGFSTLQLSLTYVSEAAIPLFVFGLYGVQRPRIGWLGLVGAVTCAYAYVFVSGTVVFAMVSGTPDWQALTSAMGLGSPSTERQWFSGESHSDTRSSKWEHYHVGRVPRSPLGSCSWLSPHLFPTPLNSSPRACATWHS